MRILLVEDDVLLGDGVAAGLRDAGFTVDWITDGEAALTALTTVAYELVVLDLGLPRRDGISVLRTLRAQRQDMPVLILTARDQVNERVTGLENGADDYVVKPVALAELVARVRALLRRAHGRAQPLIEAGNLTIDPAARTVTQQNRLVTLSPREYLLLVDLVEHRGIARTRAQLEDSLYGFGEEVGSNAVEVHVHHLRKKLGEPLIRTVRGVGYLFVPDRSDTVRD
ncbi:DNA-binding response OmpR family regulator [Silvimonas terrae]|uniref:DNA-binding response OmpR family regulator n=1 Tax=Silvimonas terrae TaxID=300266 RepID=A0A840RA85_9NEIS|nr:response regulator transcription factor [Silvimonas terrae]MBB5189366.1 DNA-binding response OmpR family regulator [Silvimonas terrae]